MGLLVGANYGLAVGTLVGANEGLEVVMLVFLSNLKAFFPDLAFVGDELIGGDNEGLTLE